MFDRTIDTDLKGTGGFLAECGGVVEKKKVRNMALVPGQQPRQKANQRIANSRRCSVDGRVDNQITGGQQATAGQITRTLQQTTSGQQNRQRAAKITGG